MTQQIRVLVTGVGGRSFGNQILHALLLLGDKYHIVTTDADSFSFGLYETPHRYIVPLANSTDYIPAISRLVKRENIDVILPGTEAETLVLAKHKKLFSESDCTIISSPAEVVKLCDDKKNIHNWLNANGFATPKTAPPSEWPQLVDEVGFPIIGKPTKGSGGSRNVAILNDTEEVNRYLEAVPNKKEIIFQEYIGTPEDEYTVGVLISKSANVIDSIVIHRKLIGLSLYTERTVNNKTYALSTGYSQGFIVKDNLIQKTCEDLALKIGIRGPANIQLRISDKKVVIFEVHSRFSGTTSIRADAGFNEPDVLIKNFLLGEEIEALDYQSDTAAIRAFRNILVPVSDLNNIPKANQI